MTASEDQPATVPDDELAGEAEASQSAEGAESAQPAAPTGSEADPDDDLRRRYREALARKHGGGLESGNQHTGPRGNAPHSNDKRQRQFRRRAGG